MKQVNTITIEEFLEIIGNKSKKEDINLMFYFSRWSVADNSEMYLVSPITLLLWFYRNGFECSEEPSDDLYDKFDNVYVIINESSFVNESFVEEKEEV